MIVLATLLLRQRMRRLQRQYGWPTALSLGVLLLLLSWKFASILARVLAIGGAAKLGSALEWAWLSWVVMGVTTGRDLTWHLRLDRLMVFRVPFSRLYALDLLLGFVSYPLFLLLCAVSFYGARGGWSISHWTLAVVAFTAFILTVRLVVSSVRTVLYRGRAFRPRTRIVLLGALIVLGTLAIEGALRGASNDLGPGRVLASVFIHRSMPATLLLLTVAVALVLTDYAIQKHVILSGLAGPATSSGLFGRAQRRLLLAGPPWPSTLWRVTMLGWLRNRNACLLFLWGTLYGLLYTWFSHPSGIGYFLLFAWMVLIFHGYLRGNLFGIDNNAVWFYFLQPVTPRQVLEAKSSTMSVLQGVMVAAVLIPAVLRPTPGMTTPFAWCCVLGFAVSALIASEIAGQLFSVLHPDPIERGSLYAGGMTMGAFAIPGIQVVILVAFAIVSVVAGRKIPVGAAFVFFIGLPLFLLVIRWRALPIWIDQLLSRDREEILQQMAAVTP